MGYYHGWDEKTEERKAEIKRMVEEALTEEREMTKSVWDYDELVKNDQERFTNKTSWRLQQHTPHDHMGSNLIGD